MKQQLYHCILIYVNFSKKLLSKNKINKMEIEKT